MQKFDYFSLENAECWIKIGAFEAYLEWYRTTNVPPLVAKPEGSMPPLLWSPLPPSSPPLDFPSSPVITQTRNSSPDSLIIISDDESPPRRGPIACSSPIVIDSPSSEDFNTLERELFADRKPFISKASGRASSPIMLSLDGFDADPDKPPAHVELGFKRKRKTTSSSDYEDDGSDSIKGVVKNTARGRKRTRGQEGVRITTKTMVDSIEHFKVIPNVWSIPRQNIGYLLDLSDDPQMLTKNHQVRTMDSLIRAQVPF